MAASVNNDKFAADDYVFPIRSINDAAKHTINVTEPSNEVKVILVARKSLFR